jgi:NADPH2:quinone reductase
MFAVTLPSYGGPEVLTNTEIAKPAPSATQLLVEIRLAGVNYLDVYQRSGGRNPQVPFTPGVEGAGVVSGVGSEVTDVAVGDRVGWFSGGSGSYADFAVVEAGRAVTIPDRVSDELALGVLLQGITAQYLATDTYPVQTGDPVLVHAAAGGVGQLLTQIVKLRGGRVIATTSTPEKAASARVAGADEVVGYDDFAAKVREATDGVGVAAVYDGIGAATFDGSLASLRPRGVLVVYGAASGPTPPLEIPRLNSGGSLYVTRPSIAHYTATTNELRQRAGEVFDWVAGGNLTVHVGGTYPISQAAEAYRELEARNTTGKILLRP